MVKSLKYLLMEVGYNPKDIKATEELIKKKNAKIIALKKQLNLSNTEHPKTKEVLEIGNQKDEMMNLIIQMRTQLKETKHKWKNLCRKTKPAWKQFPLLLFL